MTNPISSIQEQARKQRSRYKFFFLLTRVLLLAGLVLLRFLQMQASIKPVIFDWLNSALVRSANFQASLLVPQVVLPTLFCLIGLFSLALVWRWWRSFRKSQA